MDFGGSILKEGLQYLVAGGAATFAAWILAQIPAYVKLGHVRKLLVAYAAAVLVGEVAYFGMMGLLYIPPPVGYVAWIETVVGVGFLSSGLNQFVYQTIRQARKDRDGQ